MALYDRIKEIFVLKDGSDYDVTEMFSAYSISYSISNFDTFCVNSLCEIENHISNDDTYSVKLKVENSDSITYSGGDLLSFQELINNERNFYDAELVSLKFEIVKKSSGSVINVYDYNSFVSFWEKTSLLNILKLIRKYSNENGLIEFVLTEQNFEEFNSRYLFFSNSRKPRSLQANIAITENCHFGNIEDFPYNAYNFYLINRPKINNAITDRLDELAFIFSIISVFDITSISDNNLYYKLNGYKTYDGTMNFRMINKDLKDIYFKIFDWIYSDSSNVADKIGLARNIISLSFRNDNLLISDSVYLSLLSSYKLYLQENVAKYIEIRSNVIDELSWISQKSSEIVEKYLSNYQKSIFTFLSFFISVFILRFLNDNSLDQGFNKEETLFSLCFLILSLFLLVFSLWNLFHEKNRLNHKYENIKNRFTDLLEKDDIERILKNDSEFKYELNYIDKRRFTYTILWLLTILVLIVTVLSVSNYLPFCSLLLIVKGY